MHAQLAAHVDVGLHGPFGHGPPGPFGRGGQPFFRRKSTAFSISPSHSVSACLQSIIPAPVFSRSCFNHCCTDCCHSYSPVSFAAACCLFVRISSLQSRQVRLSIFGGGAFDNLHHRAVGAVRDHFAFTRFQFRTAGRRSASFIFGSCRLRPAFSLRAAACPRMQASAIREVTRRMARMASSLPGMT